MNKVAAIIPAAGMASRLGLGHTKALLKFNPQKANQKTLIEQVVEVISKQVETCLVMVRQDDLEKMQSLNLKVEFLLGGQTRQESVFNGLKHLAKINQNVAQAFTHVLIHDAARCFITEQLVARSIEAALKHGAVTAARPCVDSIKQVDSTGQVVKSLSRQNLYAIQTPQVFRFDWIWQAHQDATNNQATDDAVLLEAKHPVFIVDGEDTNIKITNRSDLARLENI